MCECERVCVCVCVCVCVSERKRERERKREMIKITYWCLDELHPLLSDALDDSRYIHHSLLLCPLQHMVDGDEGTSTAHTSTAQSTALYYESTLYCNCGAQ